MIFNGTQKRIIRLVIGAMREPAIALAAKNGANPDELYDRFRLAFWFEAAPVQVKRELLDLYYERNPNADAHLRICDNCGKFMPDGYILFGGDTYACTESCAVQLYQKNYRERYGMNQAPAEARRDLNFDLEHYPDDNFWTEW